MLRFHKGRRTIEIDEHKYELQVPQVPQLYRDLFPYIEVPKIAFNHRVVPMNPPPEIWVTDTTFRDGQQAMQPFTVQQIVGLYTMLHRLGGPQGLIRQTEFFLYTDKDREAVRRCQALGYRYPEITAWIRAEKKDFALVREMGLKETGILTSCSDYHIFLKLKKTRKQAMEQYLDIVRAALEAGIIPRCHLEDITRADFYGFVIPFVRELMRLADQAGKPVKIRACDTMGFGVTYPGASLPRSVNGTIYGLTTLAEVPSEWLEWHGHNDFYRAVNNAATAWLYGCCAANGTILGIGERTGNTPIEGLLVELIALRGEDFGMDTTVITEIAEYFEREIGYPIPANQPLVGANFNVTRAGIHADGILKDEEIYNIFDTKRILKRPVNVFITDKSGLAGIAYWVNAHLKLEKPLPKTDPRLLKMKEWVDQQYQAGRTTMISDEEMWEQVKWHLPDLYQVFTAAKPKTIPTTVGA
ncbi:MAG: 2-isopropylmalate synthase [Elusimicrobia bacterium]|nr:2-isopropylmalate synthase [Elusimicrobiota bacterium]